MSLAVALLLAAAADTMIGVSCRPLDAYSQLPVQNVRISVCDTAGAVLADSLEMTVWESNFRRAYDDVSYRGTVPAREQYRVHVAARGYEPQNFLAVPQQSFLNLGDIYLRHPRREKQLEELTVTATKIKMIMKGDTLEYDATAFQLPEGSMLDALIGALPGAAINDDGQISVNGRFISELMVNGRRFFQGDPQVALRNLPSYTVKNVRVYQRTPEQYVGVDMPDRDRKNDPLVMDVNLKPDYMNGWLANAEGGYGSSLKRFDNRWMGRLFAMRYDKFSYLAVQASANNLNDPLKAGSKGQWHNPGNINGVLTTKRASIEYNTDWHDQGGNGVNTFVDVERTISNNGQTAFSEQFLNGGNAYGQSASATRSESWATRWRGEVSRVKRGLGRIWFSTSVNYSKGKTETTVTDEQWSSAPIYFRNQQIGDNERKFMTDWRMFLSIYALSPAYAGLNGDGIYENISSESRLFDRIDYPSMPQSNMLQHRRSSLPSRRWNYSLNPYVNLRSIDGGNVLIDVCGRFTFLQSFESGRRRLEDLDEADADASPSVVESGVWLLNEANSYHTVRRTIDNKFELDIALKFNNDLRLTFDFEPHYLLRKLHDQRGGAERNLRRNSWLLDGLLELVVYHSWMRGYGVKAGVKETAPDMDRMLDVVDSANPMLISLGNSGLKKQTTLTATAYVKNELRKGSSSYDFSVDYNRCFNTLAIGRTFDRQTGVTTLRPDNVDGNYRINGYFNYSVVMLSGQNLSLSNTFRPAFSHSADFSSVGDVPELSVADGWSLGDVFEGSWMVRPGMRLSAKVDVRWSRMISRSGLFEPFSFTDVNYGIGFQSPVLWGISLDTDLMAYCRRGYAERAMNSTDIVWNLQLSRGFGPGGRWVVKAVGFDLLQQLPTVRQIVNAQGRTETRYNSRPAYGLLTVAYRLDIKPRGR